MEKGLVSRAAWLALVSACTLGWTMASAQENYLARFAGAWIGQGMLQLEGERGQTREAVYCRLTAQVSPDGAILQQSGRCAAGERSRRIAGTLVYDSTRNTVSGSWSGGPERADVAGRRRGDRLVLQLRARSGEVRGPATITLDPLSAGRYRMSIAGGEGGGEIEFRRQ